MGEHGGVVRDVRARRCKPGEARGGGDHARSPAPGAVAGPGAAERRAGRGARPPAGPRTGRPGRGSGGAAVPVCRPDSTACVDGVSTLVVTDLDGTVLFSPRSLVAGDDGLKPVDMREGRTLTSMTAAATGEWIRLVRTGALVPATTRSVPQYLRLRLPGPAPKVAIVCNGARLLVDGEPDADWEHRMRRRMRGSAAFDLVWRQV